MTVSPNFASTVIRKLISDIELLMKTEPLTEVRATELTRGSRATVHRAFKWLKENDRIIPVQEVGRSIAYGLPDATYAITKGTATTKADETIPYIKINGKNVKITKLNRPDEYVRVASNAASIAFKEYLEAVSLSATPMELTQHELDKHRAELIRAVSALKTSGDLMEAIVNADPIWNASDISKFAKDPEWADMLTALNDARKFYGLPGLSIEES